MNSLKAIEELKRINKMQNNGNGDIWLEMIIQPIEKDLEILYLIHDHPIEFSWVVKSKNYTDYIFIGGTTLPFRFSEEEFNKIKEWLENDNKN